jgi:chromate transport protein ChrA
MVGPLVAGKKAAKYGYKRYGIPGAVVAGTGAVVGTAIGIKKLKSAITNRPTDE